MSNKIIILAAISLIGFAFSFMISRNWFEGGDAISRGFDALIFFLVIQTVVAGAGVWLIILLLKYWNELTALYKTVAVAGALPIGFYVVFILAPFFRLLVKP